MSLNKKLLIFKLLLIIICISITGCANLRGKISAIHNLARLRQNDKLKTKAIKQEAINFQRVKKYIISGKMQKGLSGQIATKKFGEPVLVISQAEGEKWAYKAGDASWFSGEKIFLFFNQDGNLVEWECVDLNCSP